MLGARATTRRCTGLGRTRWFGANAARRRLKRGKIGMEAGVFEFPEVEAPALEYSKFQGLRQATLGYPAFDNASAAKNLAGWVRRWRGNSIVEIIELKGKFGSFAATDASELDEVFTLYGEIAKTDKVISVIDGVLTCGGVGMCSNWASVASDNAVFLPPLAADVRSEGAPRYADGGVSYRLSRAGALGRCAALSGIPVRGRTLVGCGLVDYLMTPHAMKTNSWELQHYASMSMDPDEVLKEEPGMVKDNIRNYLWEISSCAEELLVTDEHAMSFDELAMSCFQPDDVEGIVTNLKASKHPLAKQALHNIQEAGLDALVFAELLKRAKTKTDVFPCLDMERSVASWLLEPASTRPIKAAGFF